MSNALLAVGVLALLGQQPAQPPAPRAAPAPPPGTDIYELIFDGAADSLARAKPQAVATERGYENQPAYTPDGSGILFTVNRDGKQTDIFQFDRASRRVRQIVATPEGEYSPTVTPDGSSFSVIRVEADGTQRLWRFERGGTNPRVILTDIKPVGYHAWIDADRLALFVLGQPATLQLAHVSTGKAEVIASDIGRSIHRMPGGRAISFIQRERASGTAATTGAQNAVYWVKELDPSSGAVSSLTRTVAGSSDRDCVWLADGTLLMSAGTKIFAWKRGDQNWREVADLAAHQLGSVTRMAAAPDGKALAIVVSEPRPPADALPVRR